MRRGTTRATAALRPDCDCLGHTNAECVRYLHGRHGRSVALEPPARGLINDVERKSVFAFVDAPRHDVRTWEFVMNRKIAIPVVELGKTPASLTHMNWVALS